jgi:hypothetical protein
MISNITNNDKPSSDKITKISELEMNSSNPEIISFLDESKKSHQCDISMIDFNSGNSVSSLRYNCYWDRHPFDTVPLGCPIKYIHSNVVKSYHSEISKDIYTIKENITRKKRLQIRRKRQKNEDDTDTTTTTLSRVLQHKEYYLTDGIFCSFNCCKAFIEDNKHIRLYDNSLNLLVKMYYDMFKHIQPSHKNMNIVSAPHWRILIQYGGIKTISQFRNNFNKSEHKCFGDVNLENNETTILINENNDRNETQDNEEKISFTFKPRCSIFEENLSF